MMRPPDWDFDLLRDPWIPALTRNGETVELGLLSVLDQAPRLRGIADASPLATFGIYRLLAAVVHHYLPLEDEEAWCDAWDKDGFDDPFLGRVESECARKLRLFDAERPFYQSADVPLEKPGETLKSVGYLAPEASTGTNVAHFSHAGEAVHAFCPACCAKGLVHLPVFATAGGAGIKPGINGVPPAYVLPCGESLFHTLLLGYVLPVNRPKMAAPKDPGPLWEAAPVVQARLEKDRTGFVESLTWPPRRVRLVPGPGGDCSRCGRPAPALVRKMVFAQGWSRQKDQTPWRDPWAAYAAPKSGSAELVPVRPSEHRDLWRDFPSLFLSQEDNTHRRPELLDQIASLEHGGYLPKDTRIRPEVFGLRTDMKAKVFEWRRETFEFPAALLDSREAAREIPLALKYAAHVDGALLAGLKLLFLGGAELRQCLARLRAGEGLRPPAVEVKSNDPLVYGTRRAYWQRLEGRFRTALADDERLCRGGEAELVAWAEEWQRDAKAAARQVLDEALRSFDGDPEGAQRQVIARRMFEIALLGWKGGRN